MKKINKFILCFSLIFSFILFGAIIGKDKLAFAESEPETPLTRGYFTTSDKGVYIDDTLFSVLYRIAGREDSKIPLDAFAAVETLNLSYDNYSNIGLSTSNKIRSFAGLEYFTLSALKTIIIDGQGLTEIDDSNFNSALIIETISAKNNAIASVNLTAIDTLNAIYLDNNLLTEVDLSGLVKLGSNKPVASLINNKISDVGKIILPSSQNSNAPIKLFLANNFLSGINVTDFPVKNAAGEIVKEGEETVYHEVSLLFQKNSGDFLDGDIIDVIPDSQYPKFNVRIYSTGTSSAQIARAGYMGPGSENKPDITLGVGEFVIKFFNDNTEITSTNKLAGYEGLFYADVIEVKPLAPGFYVVVKGKAIEYKGAISENFQVYSTVDYDGGEVMMKVNGGEWKKATCISITGRGTYNIETKVVVNGIESNFSSITVVNNNNDGIVLGVVIIIGASVFGLAAYFIIMWYKNGGIVAPIEKRKK